MRWRRESVMGSSISGVATVSGTVLVVALAPAIAVPPFRVGRPNEASTFGRVIVCVGAAMA